MNFYEIFDFDSVLTLICLEHVRQLDIHLMCNNMTIQWVIRKLYLLALTLCLRKVIIVSGCGCALTRNIFHLCIFTLHVKLEALEPLVPLHALPGVMCNENKVAIVLCLRLCCAWLRVFLYAAQANNELFWRNCDLRLLFYTICIDYIQPVIHANTAHAILQANVNA